LIGVSPAVAQERIRIGVNAARQSTTTTLTQEQTFQQYFEEGSFTFDRTTPQDVVFDGGAMVRIWRNLQAGYAISFFDNTGTGDVEARVPHPQHFTQLRSTSSTLNDIVRRELGHHLMVGWTIDATRGLDFTVFAGPSFFIAQQTLVTGLTMSLDKEVFPFNELAFPGASTEVLRETVAGYNAGVDMTWRFTGNIGVGALLRYASGKKDFSPTDGSPVEVEVGGLHAGGGIRVAF
jgi:hypothetical protein